MGCGGGDRCRCRGHCSAEHPLNSGYGRVFGTPGGSLGHSDGWAANADVARIGRAGELRTAEMLDQMAFRPGGVDVIHDCRIPIPGVSANIDHVVVSGSTVWLVDSKVWRPGLYWTVAGRTFRGVSRFPFADKKTLPMAERAVSGFLRGVGRSVTIHCLLVVWPSSGSSGPSLLLYRPRGARAVNGRLLRSLGGIRVRPGDTDVTMRLAELALDRTA